MLRIMGMRLQMMSEIRDGYNSCNCLSTMQDIRHVLHCRNTADKGADQTLLICPLGLTYRTNVLEFQIRWVRFNVNYVPNGFIRLGRTGSVRTRNGFHMRKRRIIERILVDRNTGCGTTRGTTGAKIRLQNQGILLVFWVERRLKTAGLTLQIHAIGILRRQLECKHILTVRAEPHCLPRQ